MTSLHLFRLIFVLWQLLRPSSLLVLLLFAGLYLSSGRRRQIGLGLLWASASSFLIIAVLPVGQWLMGTLESRFPKEHSYPPHVDGIIVLGGAVSPPLSEIWQMPALTDGAERMTGFVGLANHYPKAKLVFAGGGGARQPGRMREADVAAQLFEQLGIEPGRVVYERESTNTWENVVFSQRLVQPKADETWILVTSAFHMPRAAAIFKQAGWKVIPWPVGYKSGRGQGEDGFGVNLPGELHLVDDAVHEWVGLVAYRVMGRL